MKRFFYRMMGSVLAVFIRRILARRDPKVVAVTGSVGKTSTTMAIALVLSKKFTLVTPLKNYNTDVGVPLTILGMESPGKNLLGWLRVFRRAFTLAFLDAPFPEVVVLELGADHPGEIQRLARLVQPHVGVVTAIGEHVPVHREFFATTEQLIKEKRALVMNIRDGGVAVLNADDPRVAKMRNARRMRVVMTGLDAKDADVRATDIRRKTSLLTEDGRPYPIPVASIQWKLHAAGHVVPVEIPHALSVTLVYAGLQAIAVAIELGMNLLDAVEALSEFQGPPGRLQALAGIKHTVVIDDSYNASPASTHAALEALGSVEFGDGQRFACLGTMAELGRQSRAEHKTVGGFAARVCDVLMTVGAEAKAIAEGARDAGMSEDHVFTFDTSAECGRFLQGRLEAGDVALVKGSQSTRMERIVKEIMAEPEKAPDLLVRQTSDWLGK